MKILPVFIIIMSLSAFAESAPLRGTNFLNTPESDLIMIRSNLSALQNDGSAVLLDGDMTQYESDFSNNLDSLDIRKMSNFSENLGMNRGVYTLAVERRKTIAKADTIFFKLWQTQRRNYQFEFITTNMEQPGLTGYLEDLYLNTKTPLKLNDSNYVNFNITTDPASANVFRFRIIFATTPAANLLPLTFISFIAFRQGNDINVAWQTGNESNLKQYVLERSNDGLTFFPVFKLDAGNRPVNNYNWMDHDLLTGQNFYRLRSTATDGTISWSNIISARGITEKISVSVYPNPVVDNIIHLHFLNEAAGIYSVGLLNLDGQVVFYRKIMHYAGNLLETLSVGNNLIKGVYLLQVTAPDGSVNQISIKN